MTLALLLGLTVAAIVIYVEGYALILEYLRGRKILIPDWRKGAGK